MAELQTCEIRLGNTVVVGQYPRMPLRFLLQRRYQEALGYTEADRKLLEERQAGDPMFEGSEPGDGYGAGCVMLAVVGLCWPTRLNCPTLRECRHDVVAYGEGVLEELAGQFDGIPGLGVQLTDEGRRLLYEMLKLGGTELTEAIAREGDFTEGPPESCTDA